MLTDAEIVELLRSVKTIAVIGLSSTPSRASGGVSRYLQRAGYRVIPVNPNETEVLGEKAYARLSDVPDKIDLVNVFRNSKYLPAMVDEVIASGAPAVWTQPGSYDAEAARRWEEAGLKVVMDDCIMQQHMRLIGW